MGLSTVLAQMDDNSNEKVGSCACLAVSTWEQNYIAMEKEALTIAFPVNILDTTYWTILSKFLLKIVLFNASIL